MTAAGVPFVGRRCCHNSPGWLESAEVTARQNFDAGLAGQTALAVRRMPSSKRAGLRCG